MARRPLKLAVLISGGGRTLVNLQEHIQAGTLEARIDIVISSHPSCKGIERAGKLGLPTIVAEPHKLAGDAFHQRITEAVKDVDLVGMAGFLWFWRIPERFRGRVINIHPALLPEFGGRGMYGHHVHEAVLAAKRRETGCTVHFCDNEYDHGPIILQRRVPVLPEDTAETLADRVFAQECIAYPEAIRLFAEGRVRLHGQEVVFRQAAD